MEIDVSQETLGQCDGSLDFHTTNILPGHVDVNSHLHGSAGPKRVMSSHPEWIPRALLP